MRTKNNSGIILIVVLWILVILSLFVFGLSRRTSIELALTRYAIGKMKSKYIAMGGFIYSLAKIKEGLKNSESNRVDIKYRCGFLLKEDQAVEDIFKGVKLGDGFFDIGYFFEDESGESRFVYGIRDEDSKLNLNALDPSKKEILSNLIALSGYDENFAETIASSFVKWRWGEENALLKKQRVLSSIDEFLMIEGVTKELFDKLKNFITVFPRTGRLALNIDTSDREVLTAFTRFCSGDKNNTTREDGDSLAEKIILYRAGEDGIAATADDRPVEMNDLPLNAKEKAIFSYLQRFRTRVSSHLLISVRGKEENFSTTTYLDAVVRRDNLSVVYWDRH